MALLGKVIVLDSHGNLIGKHYNVPSAAIWYACGTRTVERYIENGKMWRKFDIFFDLESEGDHDGPVRSGL